MAPPKILLWIGLTFGIACVVTGPAVADTFTWDPSQSTPALTNGPAAFSADALSVTNYIRTTNVNDLTTLRQTFSGLQFEVVNGFTLGGVPVAVPGLNSAYGLYFRISPAGSVPITASGVIAGPYSYSQLDVQLVADVGHDDGRVVNTVSGIGFSNAAGVNNDVVLATGSLLSASLGLNPNGSRNAHYTTTFQPVSSEAGFFTGPNFQVNLDIALNSPATTFQVFPVDSLTFVSVVGADGTATGTVQLVPEPASVGMVGAGWIGLILIRRRRAHQQPIV